MIPLDPPFAMVLVVPPPVRTASPFGANLLETRADCATIATVFARSLARHSRFAVPGEWIPAIHVGDIHKKGGTQAFEGPALLTIGEDIVLLHFLDGCAMLAETIQAGQYLRVLPMIFALPSTLRCVETGISLIWTVDIRRSRTNSVLSSVVETPDSVEMFLMGGGPRYPVARASITERFMQRLHQEAGLWIDAFHQGASAGPDLLPACMVHTERSISAEREAQLQEYLGDICTLHGPRLSRGGRMGMILRSGVLRQDSALMPFSIELLPTAGSLGFDKASERTVGAEIHGMLDDQNCPWRMDRLFTYTTPSQDARVFPLPKAECFFGMGEIAPSAHRQLSLHVRLKGQSTRSPA